MKIIFSALLTCLLWTSTLTAQPSFYEGKTVRIVVGFSPGGAYDVWARMMALIGANSFLEAPPSWCKI